MLKSKLKCSCCDKEKVESSFTLDWQKRNKICDYCATMKSVSIYGNPMKVRPVERKCLGFCGKKFLSKGNRICPNCKDCEEYAIGTRYENQVTSAAV